MPNVGGILHGEEENRGRDRDQRLEDETKPFVGRLHDTGS